MPETKQTQQRDPLVKTSEMVRLFGIVPMSAYTMRDTYEAELTRLREQVEQRITVEQAMEVVKGLALEKTNAGWGDRVLISLDTLHASLTKAAKP